MNQPADVNSKADDRSPWSDPSPDHQGDNGASEGVTEASPSILNVNDDAANRYVVSRILRNAGFEILEASNGLEGLRLVAENPPDLVILDIDLPDIDGFEVCRRIKDDPASASIPVLQLSAKYVREEDKTHGLGSGADGYLIQPVQPPELIASARSLLRLRQAEEAARVSAHRVEQLEQELKNLERLAIHPTAATARAMGASSLREAHQYTFRELVQSCANLLDVALKQQQYKIEHDLSSDLRTLGDRLGSLRAGPRDVIEIYGTALRERTTDVVAAKAKAYLNEGRMLVLELMGHLVSYYRAASSGMDRQLQRDGGSKIGEESPR